MTCPNVNSPEWKKLVGKIGIYNAFSEFIRNGEMIPNADNYQENLRGVNIAIKLSNAIIKSRPYNESRANGFYNDLKRFGTPDNQIAMLRDYITRNQITQATQLELLAAVTSEMTYTVQTVPVADSLSVSKLVDEGWLHESVEEAGNGEVFTSYYEGLSVPGGVNYRENEIRTPDITPVIRGHARFATDEGIGWFRSDDKRTDNNSGRMVSDGAGGLVQEGQVTDSKTRRILEVQSDLFQKGRETEDLIGEDPFDTMNVDIETTMDEFNEEKRRNNASKSPENKFLQLLNKENTWVTFFVKSILQDSVRRGYEKVMFPTGNTANKIEGQHTIEGFIEDRKRRIKETENTIAELRNSGRFEHQGDLYIRRGDSYYKVDLVGVGDDKEHGINELDYKVAFNAVVEPLQDEVLTFEQELLDAEGPTGMQVFRKINRFYEQDIKNVLKKQGYNPTRIKDEHGNEWQEVTLEPIRDSSAIMFQTKDVDEIPTKASPEAVRIVKSFLERVGVPIQEFNGRIRGDNGQVYTVNGIANYFQGIVGIAYGKEAETLPEEAMHFAVELMKKKNPTLYRRMFNRIGNYKLFYEVANTYKHIPHYQMPDGLPNIPMIKDEAIAKLLVEVIVKRDGTYTDHPELLVEVKSWWQQFIDWIRMLIGRAQIDPFEETIERFVEGTEDLGDASILRDNKGTNLQIAADTYNRVRTQDVNMAKTTEGYEVNGEAIRNSVESKVDSLIYAKRRSRPISEVGQRYRDFNAEVDTNVKKDLKDIFDRYIDDNGDLRDVPLVPTTPSAIDPYDETFYATLNTHIAERLMTYPAGTKFLKYVNVYDGINTAGTIDLLAMMPDDRIDILQFKVPNLPFNATDIPAWVQDAYNAEIEELRRILQTGYAIRRSQFRQTRVLPIRGYYTPQTPAFPELGLKLTKLTIGGVNTQLIEDVPLIPVPGESESTGDEQFDEFIGRLRGLAQRLAEERVSPDKRAEKAARVNKLITSIRKLQIQRKADDIIESAKSIVIKQQDTYTRLQEGMISTDPAQATIKQLDNMASDIMDQKDIVELYSDLYDVFRDVFSDGSEESKKYVEDARKISDDARDIVNRYWRTAVEFRKTKWAAKVRIKDEFVPEKQLTWYRRMIRSLSQSSTKAGELLWDLVKRINNKYVLEFQDRLVELHKIQDGVEKWLNGKTVQDLYRHIFQIGTDGKWNGAFVQKYSRDFYKDLKAAQDRRDAGWVVENVDMDAYNAWYVEEHARRVEESETTRVHEDPVQNKRIIESNMALFESTFFMAPGFYSGVNPRNFKLKDFPKQDKWKSTEYRELEKAENAPLLKLYEYWVKRLDESLTAGLIEEHNGWSWFPNVRKNLLEKLTISPSKGKLFSPFAGLVIDAEDSSFGKIDPLTRKPIDKVHAAFVTDLAQWVEGADGKYFQDYSEKSMDVFKVLALWEREIVRYKLKTESESLARLLHYTEENRDAYRTKKGGDLNRDAKQRPSMISNEVNAKYIKEHIDAVYYGKNLSDESDVVIEIPYKKAAQTINKLFGGEVVTVPQQETVSISGVKALSSINRFYVTKTLGLNVFTSLSNLFGGTVNTYINQGRSFTKSDILSAEMMIISGTFYKSEQDKKLAGLLKYFRPYADDEFNQEIRKMSLSSWIRYLASDYLFFLQRGSDRVVNAVIAIAYFRNTMVKDGKLVNIREHARKELGHQNKYAGTYEESEEFERRLERRVEELKKSPEALVNYARIEDDQLVIPGIARDSDSIINLRQSILQFIKDALGNTSREDLSLYKRSVMWQSFFMFKNWIPRLLDVRAQSLKYNPGSERYEWGRIRMLGDAVRRMGLGSISSLHKQLGGNDKDIIEVAKKAYKEKQQYFADQEQDFNMTEAEFIDMYIKGVRSEFKELGLALAMMGILVAARAFAPDGDEEPETKGAFRWMLRGLDKLQDEISFFYNPISFTSVVNGSVFPAVHLLVEVERFFSSGFLKLWYKMLGDEQGAESQHPTKYLFKIFPITKELITYLAIFNDDIAKEYGIRITSQYGTLR